jgi:3-deoxy-7-phosphoheptulonate synthase
VTPAAIRLLREQLAAACLGEAFVIQGGDCAETFSASFAEDNTRLYQLLAGQAALLSSAGARRRMIRIGRVAGQFAKPRSSPVDADGLPSFRGDIVHSSSANKAARTPDPQRLLQAYRYAATSLEQLAILGETHRSTRKSLESLLERLKADGLAASKLALTIECLAHGSEECNAPTRDRGERDTISGANIVPAMFTSHEALLLPYEESLVRLGDEALLGEAFDGVAATKSADTWADLPTDARYYATSAHFLWVGERTRQLNAAHIEFFRGIANPVGVKLSGNITLEELYALAELLNPLNTPGRLTLITRMGASTLGCKLPSLMAAARRAGLALVWVCDPMHANTITVQDSSGRRFKTRDYEAIQNELRMFLDIAASEGVPAGGIHLEMSGDSVTECLGGVTQTKTDDLARAYRSACDPRLNYAQALSLALTTSDSIQLTDVVAGSPRPVV